MSRTVADDRIRGTIVDADVEADRYDSGMASGEAIIAKMLGDPALSAVRLVAAAFEIAEPKLRVNRTAHATEVARFAAEARAVADQFAAVADRLAREPAVDQSEQKDAA